MSAPTLASRHDRPGGRSSDPCKGQGQQALEGRYASGEVDRSGRITKQGDGNVRTLLYEAAIVLLLKISRTSSLREWGLAIAQRSGFKKAKVAVARKLAVLLHRLWRDGTEFRGNTAPVAA